MGLDDSVLTYAEVIPTLDTNAYVAGDLLFDAVEIPHACPLGKPSVIYSVQVIDEDDQGIAMDLLILRSNTSMGTFNVAFSPTDAQAREILTEVEVLAADYIDYTNSQQAHLQYLSTGTGFVLLPENDGGHSLWLAGVTRGAPTHTASGIRIRLGFVTAG